MQGIQYRDLREFIGKMMELGMVRIIEGADPNLEIGMIYEAVIEMPDHPLLLFDKIKGYPPGFRLATHVVTNPRRTALAYGIPPDLTPLEMLRFWKDKLRSFKPVPPVEASDGPVLENVVEGDRVNMRMFPAPLWHAGDGGPYIGTGDVVIMRDPDEGWINLGVYRIELHDEKTLGIYVAPGHHGRIIMEKYWSRGRSCPVAVLLGPDPRVYLAAALDLPWGLSEYDFAGWLAGSPIRVIRGEVTGLPIEANAEVAIEGEIPPPNVERRLEGPFGEWTGYYTRGAVEEPVIKVRRVMYRNNPIILGSPPIRPLIGRHQFFGIPLNLALAWNKLEDAGITGITGMWDFSDGFFTVISIRQGHPGHAKRVALAAAALTSLRYVVIVDDDIDPTDIRDVLWAIATRTDPQSSIMTITDTTTAELDPMLSPEKRKRQDFTMGKVVIIATKPYQWINEFPPTVGFTKEQKHQALTKWSKALGLS